MKKSFWEMGKEIKAMKISSEMEKEDVLKEVRRVKEADAQEKRESKKQDRMSLNRRGSPRRDNQLAQSA